MTSGERPDRGRTAEGTTGRGSGSGAAPAAEVATDPPARRPVLIVADDLIWATRLQGQLRTLGADPLRIASTTALATELAAPVAERAGLAVVDLTGRSYDGIAAIGSAAQAGLRVMAVGQHDDQAQRAAARAAGAQQVHAYRTLFERGHAVLAAWLDVPVPEPGSLPAPGRR